MTNIKTTNLNKVVTTGTLGDFATTLRYEHLIGEMPNKVIIDGVKIGADGNQVAGSFNASLDSRNNFQLYFNGLDFDTELAQSIWDIMKDAQEETLA